MLTKENLLVNAWYMFAIGAGLFFAWRDGAGARALVFAALGAAVLVCLGIVGIMIYKRYAK